MEKPGFSRRNFIKTAAMASTAMTISGIFAHATSGNVTKNPIPRWKGFNLLDYFSPNHGGSSQKTTEQDLKWMRDWGFDFVRLPMAYPSYLNIDRSRNIKPEEVYHLDEKIVDEIEQLVYLANKYGLHVSMNLHRAPGYCINAGFHEPYNLWLDDEAQRAFCYHWEMWAKRFKNLSNKQISFDLVNEPAMREDMNNQHTKVTDVPGHIYRKVAVLASDAIRKANPNHLVIADGNLVGSKVIPEIMDLNIAQSCRGYYPGEISHYQAPWANKNPELNPIPVWPGQIGNQYYSRKSLEEFYQPWIDLVRKGVGVHCGECGCWKNTPHGVFLAWFGDVLDVLTPHGIGYGLWNFHGDFGILNSNRRDVQYEDWHGQKLDRKLLTLLQKY
jgi:aryl-phospho-beta-D-glucosidase BglC (GH1 family)